MLLVLRFRKIAAFTMVASVIITLASCTPLREITYLNGIHTGDIHKHGAEPDVYTVRPNDLLYINVIGDDPVNTAFLNLTQTVTAGITMNLDLITYIVDEKGQITFPYFGSITVEGLTVNQIRDILQEKVNQYMQNASVFVKHVNRTITVLGEVRSPGQHAMVKNRLTIFEALALAGDINDFGDRRNVKLIREISTGKMVEKIDLTDPQLLYSDFYYIMPHDMIYIEPSSKIYGNKTMPFGTAFNLIFSTISTTLLLINFFK